MKRVAILGSTGSLGRQALEVIAEHSDKLKVVALTAYSNCNLLNQQIQIFEPEYIAYPDKSKLNSSNLKDGVIFTGDTANLELAEVADYDILLTTVIGFSGLLPTIAAIKRGKTIALANKETLVAAGKLVMTLAKQYNAKIIPVDSEHSALMQCLEAGSIEEVNKLIITASGGAFRDVPLKELSKKRPQDALKHPNWSMGAKITIDSATMVNKGFEVIEAMHLFDIPLDKIDVVMHRESIVHSMVEYIDGSIIAQLSNPDMRLPLQLALLYPQRCDSPIKKMTFNNMTLSFTEVDISRYPCFELAMCVASKGGVLPAVFNAADEIAVENYLNGNIGYADIHKLIEQAVLNIQNIDNYSIDDILAADKETRSYVNSLLRS